MRVPPRFPPVSPSRTGPRRATRIHPVTAGCCENSDATCFPECRRYAGVFVHSHPPYASAGPGFYPRFSRPERGVPSAARPSIKVNAPSFSRPFFASTAEGEMPRTTDVMT
jgi:hypothetical protein